MYRVLPHSLGSDGKIVRRHASLSAEDALPSAIATVMTEFVCPSYNGVAYNQGIGSPNATTAATVQQAITNYKAMGASCKQSLQMAANSSTLPSGLYGTATIHPDGAIYPSTTNLPASQFVDGLSCTIFLCETVDSTASCWLIGSECVMTGLPGSGSNSQGTPCSVPTGTTPAAPYNYFTPAHYYGTWGDSSGVTRAGMRTF